MRTEKEIRQLRDAFIVSSAAKRSKSNFEEAFNDFRVAKVLNWVLGEENPSLTSIVQVVAAVERNQSETN